MTAEYSKISTDYESEVFDEDDEDESINSDKISDKTTSEIDDIETKLNEIQLNNNKKRSSLNLTSYDIPDSQPDEGQSIHVKTISHQTTENFDKIVSESNNTNVTNKTESLTSYDLNDIELEISSHPPSDFTEHDNSFHLSFIIPTSLALLPNSEKKYKNRTRYSLSFTNDQVREIDRKNRILLNKISKKKSVYANTNPNGNPNPFARIKTLPPPVARITSATINRQKQQRKIDMDNQVLRHKIESIERRSSKAV